MDQQLIAFTILLGLLALGLWLMFGKPGNKKPSGGDPEQFHSGGSGAPHE